MIRTNLPPDTLLQAHRRTTVFGINPMRLKYKIENANRRHLLSDLSGTLKGITVKK